MSSSKAMSVPSKKEIDADIKSLTEKHDNPYISMMVVLNVNEDCREYQYVSVRGKGKWQFVKQYKNPRFIDSDDSDNDNSDSDNSDNSDNSEEEEEVEEVEEEDEEEEVEEEEEEEEEVEEEEEEEIELPQPPSKKKSNSKEPKAPKTPKAPKEPKAPKATKKSNIIELWAELSSLVKEHTDAHIVHEKLDEFESVLNSNKTRSTRSGEKGHVSLQRTTIIFR